MASWVAIGSCGASATPPPKRFWVTSFAPESGGVGSTLDPDPFMEQLSIHGLPWTVVSPYEVKG